METMPSSVVRDVTHRRSSSASRVGHCTWRYKRQIRSSCAAVVSLACSSSAASLAELATRVIARTLL
jgi:hypothetical protein